MPIDEPAAREIDAQIQQWSEWFGVTMDEKAASGLCTMIHRYAASNEARLQREVEVLRAEIVILRSEIDCSEQELDDVRRGEGYDELENEIARLRAHVTTLPPPAASEEDAS